MSRNPAMDAARVEKTKERMLKAGFRKFSACGIEPVSMPEFAKEFGMARSMFYLYFPTKLDFAIAISAYAWNSYNQRKYEETDAGARSAAERYRFWLDSFLELYREHQDLLRYNQFFNVYVANKEIPDEQMEPFNRVIKALEARFHGLYELGKQDGTLKTDVPEEEIFSTTLHLMLAATTRYAVGLVYESRDPEKELERLKGMLIREFTMQGEPVNRNEKKRD